MYHPKTWLSLMLTVALLVLAACSASEPTSTDPNSANPTAEQTPLDTANLPTLPRLEASGGPGGGGGGGGFGSGGGLDAAVSTEAYSEGGEIAMDAKIGFAPYSVFSGTQFVLNATLPTQPSQATVQRAPEFTLTQEQATAWAAQFGFPTPLYQEIWEPAFYDNMSPGEIRMPYFSFKGSQQLNLSGYGIFYYDSRVTENYPSQVNFTQAAPIAEALVQGWGILNFPYVMEEGYNGDVSFKRVVEGQSLNYAEIYVHFNDQYEVVYVNYNPIMGLETLGQYPLISAEAAWQQIQAGLDSMEVPYELLPNPEQAESLEDPNADQYKYWQRAYAPGEAITGYSGVMAYRPTDGGVPLVRYNNYQILGNEEDLRGLADNIGRTVIIEGNISDDGQSINLANWSVRDQYVESLYLEGVIGASDQPNTLLLTTIDGQVYLIPNAPADLEVGTEVYVFAWDSRDLGGQYPTLDWQGIDKKVFYNYDDTFSEAPSEGTDMTIMPVEPGFGYGFGYTQITFDKVELGYYYMPQWDMYPTDGSMPSFDVPPVMVQPVWKFSGTAVNDSDYTENIVIYIQAVDPAFVQPAP